MIRCAWRKILLIFAADGESTHTNSFQLILVTFPLRHQSAKIQINIDDIVFQDGSAYRAFLI
uniref:Uncharacterized protein n=1 Tax=Octopus bimaculoides TaxID=37653 RepID=A0A0L8HPF1_OCTBM